MLVLVVLVGEDAVVVPERLAGAPGRAGRLETAVPVVGAAPGVLVLGAPVLGVVVPGAVVRVRHVGGRRAAGLGPADVLALEVVVVLVDAVVHVSAGGDAVVVVVLLAAGRDEDRERAVVVRNAHGEHPAELDRLLLVARVTRRPALGDDAAGERGGGGDEEAEGREESEKAAHGSSLF